VMLVTGTIADAWPQDCGDVCGNVFGESLRAMRPPIKPDANVLEIGCAEFDWLSLAGKAWPEMVFTGIDWRARNDFVNWTTRIHGDVLTEHFEPNSFDWIVAISTIEHIGLGHYQRDPLDTDGDTKAMARAFEWLKPGGWMYLDVPYGDKYEVRGTKCRVYDWPAILKRLMTGAWIPEQATSHADPEGRYGYFAMWLRKPPNG
jgi:SAM-dependent methyltransferase